MKFRTLTRFVRVLTVLACACVAFAQQNPLGSLHGTVTDPSGASVPQTLVQVIGNRLDQRASTGADGQYSFAGLPPGKYRVRFIAKGFSVGERIGVDINGGATLDFQFSIEASAQVINVEDEANSVSTDPTQNGGAIVVGQSQLDALSDDPDILQQQLTALAGPGAGPNGGQIYVDGFSGAQLPPKASIQEIRINTNPYSPENEYPGGSGIQIITKPGSSTLHGNVMAFYNDEALNSRSPLLTQSKRPPYRQQSYYGTLSGQLKKNKASWSLNASRNASVENAFIYATTLDSSFNPLTVNQTITAPRGNWNWQPRIDYAINSKHTLWASYFNGHNHAENQGVGDFSLASRAYRNHGGNDQVQVSETAILSSRMVSDTRFQFFRNTNYNVGDNTVPSTVVPGAFSGGGAQIGNSGATSTSMELVSTTSFGYKTHTFRWGGRLRESIVNNTSVSNFGGTYTFQGGFGPELDASYQAIPDTTVSLTALDVYRRTLLLQSQGLSDDAIRRFGGGAYQFSRSAGQPTISVKQFDAGLFFVDDWRARPTVTFSYGLRYEGQSNISDHGDWAPRVAVAWNVDSKKGKPGKTVLRAGAGAFYSRIPLTVTQNALRFNGVTQQSFVVFAPSFYPAVPDAATLANARLPQQLQLVDSTIRGSQIWQGSAGVDRQIGKFARISANYNVSRGIHLQRARDINAPRNGLYPFSDQEIRILTETTGFSRTQQLTVTPSVNYKKLFIAGYYTLSFGKTDSEGQPADPYNLRAEWGPSSYADVRHRMFIIFNTPLPTKKLAKFSLSTQFSFTSGSPYNITTGRDLNNDTILSERPQLLSGLNAAGCTGASLVYRPEFGCFNPTPLPGTSIERNFARGPQQTNIGYASLSRTWILNPTKEAASKEATVTVPGPGGTSIQVPASMMGGMGGPAAGKRKYNLTFSINAQNPLNHTTYNAPSGDLSSPYFGVYRSISSGGYSPSGSSTFNRRVSLQLRLNF